MTPSLNKLNISELLPCPFCGVEAQGIIKLNTIACSSPHCGGGMRWAPHEPFENAVIAWNTRSTLNQADIIERLRNDNDEMRKLINTPEVEDFAKGAVLEAAHQRQRWPSQHDEGKTPFDWFWLIGYLAQKAASAQVAGDNEKALHHTISTAAALANWHLAITGTDTTMRPGTFHDLADAALTQQGVSPDGQ